MRSKIAVLASNSFAGSAFVAHALRTGHEVLGLSRSPEPEPIFLPYREHGPPAAFRFSQADLREDFERVCTELDRFEPDFVVDFAGQGMVAESWGAPEQWYATNIVAKVRVHDFLRRRPWLKRYVRVSTPEVYGSHNRLIDERQPYNPSTPYAVSHAAIDMSLAAFHRNYGFPVVIGRFANFYGPHQQLYRIIPRTIVYARLGRKLQLHGGGTSIRAFIHAADVASGIALLLSKAAVGGVYHFSSERFLPIRDVVQLLCDNLGVPFANLVEISGERPAKDHAYLMDSTKARKELGWSESIPFVEGIRQTIAWVDRNLDTIRKLPLEYVHKP
jgi:dTDP-glucose 4,6-dehydratase